ncbi:LCP family protein [Fodinisporobacter ferrooxydans]|uniref:LCP family protein n=1 Tax=Fodinisporobacter ferrooxydans TaxID=2901836 RepID=A0ABY4CFQ4_9BACL|nr:LCP family protein [Alicyclobacillaceae bacterium MYW30-H2]
MQSRQERNKKRMPLYKRKGFWLGILIPILVLVGVSGYYWYRINHFVSQIQGGSDNSSTVAWSGKDRVNIMLFGVDNRGGDPHPRTDVNLLVSIDPKTHTAEMFSILRDTWYKIPGYSSQKINAAYSLGGPSLAIKTFSDFLQIPINYYAVTDFQGFEKIVDAVGGINLYVEKNMDYTDDGVYDIHLKKGYQHLDGRHALEYVRFRHDAMGDFWRTERQRNFLKALAEQMKKPANILKVPSILDAIQPYIKTNMTMDDMLKLGMLAKDINWANMKSQQVPDMKDLKTGFIDGEDSVIPNVYATRVMVHKMLGMNDAIQQDPSVEYQGSVSSQPSGSNASSTQPELPANPQAQEKTGNGNPNDQPTNPFGSGSNQSSAPSNGDGKGTGSTGTDPAGNTQINVNGSSGNSGSGASTSNGSTGSNAGTSNSGAASSNGSTRNGSPTGSSTAPNPANGTGTTKGTSANTNGASFATAPPSSGTVQSGTGSSQGEAGQNSQSSGTTTGATTGTPNSGSSSVTSGQTK